MPRDLFSRLVPNKDDRPFYQQLRDDHTLEDRAASDLDEENLAHNFQNDDLDHAERLSLEDSRLSTRSPVESAGRPRGGAPLNGGPHSESRWLLNDDDGDNDVPASLLVEGPEEGASKHAPLPSSPRHTRRPGSSGRPNRRRIQAQWEAAQAQQRLHPDDAYDSTTGHNRTSLPTKRPGFAASPKDKAMFRWANVSNLDVFIRDVYDYYLGAGLWCIVLDRALHLLYVFPKQTAVPNMEADVE